MVMRSGCVAVSSQPAAQARGEMAGLASKRHTRQGSGNAGTGHRRTMSASMSPLAKHRQPPPPAVVRARLLRLQRSPLNKARSATARDDTVHATSTFCTVRHEILRDDTRRFNIEAAARVTLFARRGPAAKMSQPYSPEGESGGGGRQRRPPEHPARCRNTRRYGASAGVQPAMPSAGTSPICPACPYSPRVCRLATVRCRPASVRDVRPPRRASPAHVLPATARARVTRQRTEKKRGAASTFFLCPGSRWQPQAGVLPGW